MSIAEAAPKAAAAVARMRDSLGLPSNLTECGADPALIPECAKWAIIDTSVPGNPRTFTISQIEELFRQAF